MGGPTIGLGHADTRPGVVNYSQQPPSANSVWATNSRAHYPTGQQHSTNSWLDNTRPYEYEGSFVQRDPTRDAYAAAPIQPNAYYAQRAAASPQAYYEQGQRYGDYRPDQHVPPVADQFYGQQSVRPLYEPPRVYQQNPGYYTPQNGNRGNFARPQQRPFHNGPPSNMRNRNQKRPFQQNRGFNNGKRNVGDMKRSFNADDKKKPGGSAGRAIVVTTNKDTANGASPTVKDVKTPNNTVDKSPNEKRERVVPKAMLDDLNAYLEKSKSMGETRKRTARFKLYRLFSAPGMNYTTSTEQVGSFAKRAQLHMKVELKPFFPQFFGTECEGILEYEDASYECATRLMLKLNKAGLLPVECIAYFYDKKPQNARDLFDQTKQCFKLLIEEIEKHEFSADFKEGKAESAEQFELLQSCIDSVAERLRNNDLPPIEKNGDEKSIETDSKDTSEEQVEEKSGEEEPTEPVAQTEAAESAEVKPASDVNDAENANETAKANDDDECQAKRAKLEKDEQSSPTDLDCTDEA
ncbi:hypothetical protein M3Y94_00465400 [Aphelenchoides besseyi]|nr:hypothetical protein M3Y94_00465400 [Aphelenchoides besseyi]